MSKLKVTDVRSIEKLNYLKAYEISYKTKSGKDAKWELVSRAGLDRLQSEIFQKSRFSDGVMVFAVDETHTKVAMIKEFRVSAGGYVYMFPAGLINQGEELAATAKREFFEETGLSLELVHLSPARYVSVGIVNECVNVAFGYYSGIPSKQHQEDKEEAEIVFIDKAMAQKILAEEDVTIRSAQLLEQFFDLNPFMAKVKQP
ncbi:NUDIX hydrolase [Fusibacter paucivorans]|uniref:NUDIX hydrolase n=1 Tax=Fusibacter paucivorans TaxID=76009 RepID=A0ABS5PSI8_9FIRM|nr:NUDIX hydrolase [Fusibacter paucivorans]MBS7528041.1 NUDIX hydrolase [Fusibacter paucivorans]